MVIEKTYFSTKYFRWGFYLWKPNPRLLQKDIGAEEKSINIKIKIITCYRGFKVRLAKLWIAQAILKR